MGRLTSDYPEKFTMRVSEEQRKNFIALAWLLGMEGKYGLSVRWFFDRFWPRMIAEWSDEQRAKFEEYYKTVEEHEFYSNPLLDKKEAP